MWRTRRTAGGLQHVTDRGPTYGTQPRGTPARGVSPTQDPPPGQPHGAAAPQSWWEPAPPAYNPRSMPDPGGGPPVPAWPGAGHPAGGLSSDGGHASSGYPDAPQADVPQDASYPPHGRRRAGRAHSTPAPVAQPHPAAPTWASAQ